MRIPVQSFKDAVLLFEAGLVEREPNDINKVALAIGLRHRNGSIFGVIDSELAKDGYVDVDELRDDINAGMDAGKGKISLNAKVPKAAKEYLGVTLDKITITKDYADYFFDKIIPSVVHSAED